MLITWVLITNLMAVCVHNYSGFLTSKIKSQMKYIKTEHEQNKLRVSLHQSPKITNEGTYKQRLLHSEIILSEKTERGESLLTSQINNLQTHQSSRSNIQKTVFSSSSLGKKSQKEVLKFNREKLTNIYHAKKRFHRDIFENHPNTKMTQSEFENSSTTGNAEFLNRYLNSTSHFYHFSPKMDQQDQPGVTTSTVIHKFKSGQSKNVVATKTV